MNAALRRTIQTGNSYDHYFVGSSCKSTFLGNGDTAHSVKKMKQWANKFAHHTKKLALGEFAGKNIDATVSAIHHFLYWNIQYNIDLTDQNLKSPACAWATRQKGTDCKGYSIFASTILQNLGIKHYFRKIKQPYYYPDLWSHVYVVIPKDQKKLTVGKQSDYYVLDATVPDNKEVLFSDLKDDLMSKVSLPHYGLAAPAVGLNACSCTKKAPTRSNNFGRNPKNIRHVAEIALRGLGAPDEEMVQMNSALNKFDLFLADLVVNKGLPVENANRAKERLAKFIKIGVEPTILDLFAIPISKKKASGLGITAPVLTNVNQLPSSTLSNLNRGASSNSGGILNNIGGTSGALSLVSSIIPKQLVSKTFGQVFANGLNFKCWGSSWTPSRAEKEIPEFIAMLQQKFQAAISVPVGSLESSINRFFSTYPTGVKNPPSHPTADLEAWIGWRYDSAKDCTLNGLKALDKGIDNYIESLNALLPQIGEQLGVNIESVPTRVTFYRHRSAKGKPYEKIVPQVKVTKRTNTAPTQNNTLPTLSDSFVDQQGNINLNNQEEPKTNFASMGWIAGGLLAAVAIGAVVMKDKKTTIVKKN